MTNVEKIPASLAGVPQWLCYKLVDTGKGRLGKPPVSPRTGRVTSKTDESQFTTLEEALIAVERFNLDGVGFVFTKGLVAIDLDDCFDEHGSIKPVAQDIFDHFTETYWEYSPSGNGLHGFMFGVKPNERTKDSALGIEVYSDYSFVTVTGDWVEGTHHDAVDMQEALDWLYDRYLPPIVTLTGELPPVEHGERTAEEWLELGLSKDEKLKRLYMSTEHVGDESSIDFALLSKLAYWLNRDVEAMMRAFRDSPWARSKDRAHVEKLQRKDYLLSSARKAAALCAVTAFETSKLYETRAVRFFTLTPQTDGTVRVPLEDYTDLGNAEAMATVFGDVLCYTPEWDWCFYNGARWETNVRYRAMEAARDIAKGLMTNAKRWQEQIYAELEADGIDPNSEEGKRRLRPAKELYNHAIKTQSEHGITAMVNLNKAYMNASASSFDADPWLLCTPSGVVDLKTGELMPHDRKYRLTRSTAVTPMRMPTPRFDAFLSLVFSDDDELIDFVQRTIGSALIGKVYNENLIIANGIGANGKSTFFNTFQSLLGDYAVSINPDLLMSSKANEQQIGMAMLQGRRLAVAQETEEGQRLRSSMLKRLVSTDKMVAKRLYKDPHEFVPSHTLVLSTNHLPKVSSTDLGTWRRILVLPFTSVIPSDKIITDYHSVLIEEEGPGILQWAVDGAVKFWERNCDLSDKPAVVREASQEYRESEDWVAAFLNECCTICEPYDETVLTRHSDLYHAYQRWARERGEYLRSSNAFGRALQTAGLQGKQKYYDPERKSTTKVWFSVTLSENGRNVHLRQGVAGG